MIRMLFMIPARGGSKGLPGKNLALLGGIPLVGRVVRTARQALAQLKVQGRVIISTDDAAIAEAAQAWGADVPFMWPAELASDTAASVDVLMHAMQELQSQDFDLIVLMQATSPLVQTDDVAAAVRLALQTADPVVAVCEAEHPAQWQFALDDDRYLRQAAQEKQVLRRQDAKPSYRLNGAIYVATPTQIKTLKGFLGEQTRAYVMPAERSVDIDSAHDLSIARALLAEREVKSVAIGERLVGPGQPCFIIAEAGVNHNGDMALAKKLIDAGAEAGVDAVKFQIFKAEAVISDTAPKAAYQKKNTGEKGSQLEMARALELSFAEHQELQAYCAQRGVLYLASPFDADSLQQLVQMEVPAIKLGSGELTNHLFLRQVAATGLPVLLSTGMANMREVDAALEILRQSGDPPVLLFHCVSSYPSPSDESNLAAMDSLRQSFACPTGWSDHSLGLPISLAAVARGAQLLEKHFTLDKTLPGPDHVASIDPAELKQLVAGVRAIEGAIGDGDKWPQACELDTRAVARRSLHLLHDLAAETVLQATDLQALRPGTGLAPTRLNEVVGRRLARVVKAGQILALEDLQ